MNDKWYVQSAGGLVVIMRGCKEGIWVRREDRFFHMVSMYSVSEKSCSRINKLMSKYRPEIEHQLERENSK